MYLRIWFCVLFLSLSFGVALAQVKFGVKAGGNVSFLSAGNYLATDILSTISPGSNLLSVGENLNLPVRLTEQARIGYHAGVFLKLKFGPFGLQTDLLYSALPTQQTLTLEGLMFGGASLPSVSLEITRDFSYLTVPIAFRFHLPLGPYVQLGPQVNYLLSQKGTARTTVDGVSTASGLPESYFEVPIPMVENTVVNSTALPTKRTVNTYEDIDWGLFGGAGFDFPFGLSIDIRYYTAISRFYNTALRDNNLFTSSNHRLQVASLAVGYAF